MEEIWKDIEGYPDYQVSNLGKIKSFKQNKNGTITIGSPDYKNYLKKTLYNKNSFKTFAVHRLGLSHSNIVRTLKGRTHTCGGRQWFYVED